MKPYSKLRGKMAEMDVTGEAWKSLKAQQAGKVLYYLLHFENAA